MGRGSGRVRIRVKCSGIKLDTCREWRRTLVVGSMKRKAGCILPRLSRNLPQAPAKGDPVSVPNRCAGRGAMRVVRKRPVRADSWVIVSRSWAALA